MGTYCGCVGQEKQTPEETPDGSNAIVKASKVLQPSAETNLALQGLYQKAVEKSVIKETKIIAQRSIGEFVQNPKAYISVSGKLETKSVTGFVDKPVQKYSEGYIDITKTLKEMGIGYACKKGAKTPPNQDDFSILVDGDTIILGVFDGHGMYGHYCSYTIQQLFLRFLLGNPFYKQNLELALQQTYQKTDEALRGIAQDKGHFSVLLSGSTTTVIVIRDGSLYISHVGDSRAIMGKADTTDVGVKAIALTKDHSPELEGEKKRIISMKGEVRKPDQFSPARVFKSGANYPGLAMSRAIGDEIAKGCGVVAEPEIKCQKIEKEDEFVIVASDGVWEFISNQEVAEVVHSNGKAKAERSASLIAENSFKTWLERENNTTDDITCLIYYLK